jgi:hypothetical protein
MDCHAPEPCKYHGWLGLGQWCRHPDHLEPIEPGRRLAIEAAGDKCVNHVEWEAKVMPNTEPPWPMPVDLQELFPREVARIGFCTHGVQNWQMECEK